MKSFLVTKAGKLAGIVCLEDVKAVASEKREDTRVREIMTPKERLEALSPEQDGSQALARLAVGKINQIPVMEDTEVKGIVFRTNILDFLHLRCELGV